MAPATPQGHPAASDNDQIGPHPSFIQVAKPYIFEQKLQDSMIATGVTEAKEDNIRLQGVAWIDSVRKALQLPVRTYNTAVVYYHKFRLVHVDNEYSFIDAAAAALFTACKIEDTLKKSREILCAAYNLKLVPAEQLSPDDSLFESHSKAIIGLERLMLEASGFDFRSRYPQKLVMKLLKIYNVDRETVGKTAYSTSLDIYRTFAPLKQTTPAMAIACLELAARICQPQSDFLNDDRGLHYQRWSITREEVMGEFCSTETWLYLGAYSFLTETLLDLLDLYTHHRASTIVGQEHPLDTFIAIRITLNNEASKNKYPRYTGWIRKKPMTNGTKASNGTKDMKEPRESRDEHKSPPTPPPIGPISTNGARSRVGERGKDGTVRFMLDAERARLEKDTVAEYFKVEEEEYEVEVEIERERRKN
ncbi:MAG: RNA polymerase II C-terminal domain kinase beta subunit [Pycnora praestabilis]|nr:MAG: RNA polymerase II C-terminal domain kinase beta subunit [Pycnora praestabilis]